MPDVLRKRSQVATLFIAAAVAVATVLVLGGIAGTFALMARCGENTPPDRLAGCNWLEDDHGWFELLLVVAALPPASCAIAFWRQSPWIVPLTTLVAVAVATVAPFLIAR